MKKKAPAKRKKAGGLGQEEVVREAVSRATGVSFEIVPPHPAFPLPVEKLDWFMRCRNKEEIGRAPYLNVVWKEKGGAIWMESLAVGDTVDWIELAYGDEQVNKSLDIDYSIFSEPSFQADFGRRFPIVLERIRRYEEAVSALAKRKKLHLELRHTGARGILVFTVAARMDVRKGASAETLETAVQKHATALKEAYEAVGSLD